MTATSQNGWEVPLTASQRSAWLTYISIPGGKLEVRKGATAAIFTDLATQYAAHVQKLIWPGCWGFYVRPIRGQSSGYSNHSSGTAIDLNAPLHPRENARYPGFTAAQVAAVRRILARYAGTVRWGADYVSDPKDAMHFEIVGSAAQIAAVATRLTQPTPTPAPAPPIGEDMLLLINDGHEHTFLTNGVTMRWVKTNAEEAIVKYNMVHHFGYAATDPSKVPNYKVPLADIPYFGVIVGDNPYAAQAAADPAPEAAQ